MPSFLSFANFINPPNEFLAMKNVCELQECPDCASSNVICDDAREQLICRDCGLIFEPLAPESKKKFEKTRNISLKGKAKKVSKKAAKKAKKQIAKKPVRKKKGKR